MTTTNKSMQIKYSEIEAVDLKTKTLTKGLFYGMMLRDDVDMIRLYVDKNSSIYISPQSYALVSITTVYGNERRKQTFFKADERDQKLAMFKVREVLMQLRVAKICNGEFEVDIKRYKDVPSYYELEKATKTPQMTPADITRKKSTENNPATTTTAATTTKSNVKIVDTTKPKDAVFIFRRKTKKPTTASLKAMKKKVEQIANDEFVLKLPKIKEDNKTLASQQEDPNVKAAAVAQGFMDEYDNEMYGHMMH